MSSEAGYVAPKVSVSYSWEVEERMRWVGEIAARLRGDGVEASLDRARGLPADTHGWPMMVPTPRYINPEAFEKGFPVTAGLCSDESVPSLHGPQSAPFHSADLGP